MIADCVRVRLHQTPTYTGRKSEKGVSALWDEDQRRLVGFLEARASLVSGPRNDQVRASSSASLGATG